MSSRTTTTWMSLILPFVRLISLETWQTNYLSLEWNRGDQSLCLSQLMVRMEICYIQRSNNSSKSNIMTIYPQSKISFSVGSVSNSTAYWLLYSTAGIACPLTCAESRPWLGGSPGTLSPGPASPNGRVLGDVSAKRRIPVTPLWVPSSYDAKKRRDEGTW